MVLWVDAEVGVEVVVVLTEVSLLIGVWTARREVGVWGLYGRPGVEGNAGFLKMPALEAALDGGVAVESLGRCFRGDTKGLWTPVSRRRRLGRGSAMLCVSGGCQGRRIV